MVREPMSIPAKRMAHHLIPIRLSQLLDKCFHPGLELAHILHAVIGFDAQARDILLFQGLFDRYGLHEIGLAELQAVVDDAVGFIGR